MNKVFLLTSALIVSATQFGCADKLMGPGGHMRLLGERPPCSTDRDCPVPVYVSVGQGQSCVVEVSFEAVRVSKGKHPKVVWNLVSLDPADGFEYQFDRTLGIDIDRNDPTQDFDDGQRQGDGKFSWRSVNKRPRDFKYTVNVERRTGHSGSWVNCPPLDPKIINDGP
jgi:hypothetical protein